MTVKGIAKAVISLDGIEFTLGGEVETSCDQTPETLLINSCMENINNEMHRITINIKNTLNKGVFYIWEDRKMKDIPFKELKIISMTTSNLEDLEIIDA